MGITKSDLFTKEQNDIALLAKTIGHPARVAILQRLLNEESCVNSSLVSELGLAQPTISQHLKELKRMELIQGSIDGNKLCYCINQETWAQAKDVFEAFFKPTPKT
ncbi:MAG: metalloregulator ArsR/SmtB family transcription factor, partial [Bacteroidota bacterium]